MRMNCLSSWGIAAGRLIRPSNAHSLNRPSSGNFSDRRPYSIAPLISPSIRIHLFGFLIEVEAVAEGDNARRALEVARSTPPYGLHIVI
jgi:hypothetical protein